MKQKKKWGDRPDGRLVRDADAMHFIMPIIYPNRADNEAFISERIDLRAVNRYLEKKNSQNPPYRYNMFQVMVAAVLKTITLRPKMNRFIANRNLYERNYISAAFVVKKLFNDDGGEGMAVVRATPGQTIDDVHNEIYRKVSAARSSDGHDSTESAMELFRKLPRCISKTAVRFICMLDRHGKVPKSMIQSDPFYNTVVLSNLGSIKLHAGYHHLTNWGTTSVFLVVGEMKSRPFYLADGTVEMRDSVDIGLTVDERIADGYYFSKTVKLLKTILENPEILDQPFEEEVNID